MPFLFSGLISCRDELEVASFSQVVGCMTSVLDHLKVETRKQQLVRFRRNLKTGYTLNACIVPDTYTLYEEGAP
jgi:hypothetical protein